MKNKVSINLEVSLVEIILSVLIFAAAGIIMLNCFAIARYTQFRANDKVIAGTIVQSDFEIIKSSDSVDEMDEMLEKSYTSKQIANNYLYTKYFDKNWNISESQKEYAMIIMVSGKNSNSGELKNISITIEKTKPYPFINKKGAEKIYSIETKKFFSLAGGDHGE